jgi:hypothetical protein
MSDKNLFEFVKGVLKKGPTHEEPGPRQPGPRQGPVLPARQPKQPDPDDQNPATIERIGRSTDGRELIMTRGFGIFLVDREAPTICYYNRGAVAPVPIADLQGLYQALMMKRNVGEFAAHYVDLLNVAFHEIDVRRKTKNPRGKPVPPPPPPPKKPPSALRANMPDAENPATIMRVGRSQNGGELVMTLGLGTFVVHRDEMTLRYFDRGREWEVPDLELQLLIDSLMAKEDMKAHQFTYIDLLNVATFVQEKRQASRRRR